ncbi:sterol desaturase family protein [Shewanella metallivivens]|uniref:Sterol desaturase family protein n=1 Tax=Shewanella metallivivens TaxID=2872342 RepID=A0ABT5TJ65_9GAMM|nr:sterol desaturase family protein [Shewanella metallivivens]
MIEIIYEIWNVVSTAILNLGMLSVLFFLLAFLVKGKEAVTAFRNSFSNSMFNLSIMCFNLILLPMVAFNVDWIYSFDYLSAIWVSVPEILVILVAIFCGDFIGYWRHRLEHTRLLWPSHAMHHSDTHMTWLTLQRFHPFNRLSTMVIDSIFLLSLGFPPYALIASNLVRHYYGYFIHADLPWDYGRWNKIFVSPVMHRWHHAAESAAHNTNFATVFSIFDRVFGTYRVPSLCNVPLGISYNVGGNLIGQLLYPLKFRSYFPQRKNRPTNSVGS